MAAISGGNVIAGTGTRSLGPFSFAGAPVSGGAGTLANVAPKGALLVDTTNAKLYINTNTQASPTWTVAGTQS